MPVNLSIKDVPDALADSLRLRAALNHRSLQGELMAIVEAAATAVPPPAAAPAAVPAVNGSRTQGWKSIEQVIAERQSGGWKRDPKMARLPRGTDILRADRDSR